MLVNQSNLLSLRDALQAIFRRRFLVTMLFIMIAAPIGYVTFKSPEVYRASAKVLLRRDDRPAALNPFSPRLSQEEEIKSELEIATSRPVLESVLKATLALRDTTEFFPAELFGMVDSTMLIKQRGENPSKLAAFSDSAAQMIRTWVAVVKKRLVARPMPMDSTALFEIALERFRNRIAVTEIRGANVLEISYEDTHPRRAAWMTNALANSYAAYNAQVHGGQEAEAFLTERIRSTQDRLDSLDKELYDFRAATGLVSYDKQEAILWEKYKTIDYQRAKVNEQAEILSERIQRLHQAGSSNRPMLVPTAGMDSHPAVRQLYTKLTELRLERNALEEKYKPDHRSVMDVTRQIEVVQDELKAEIERLLQLEEEELQSLRMEEEVLARILARVKDELLTLPGKEKVFNDLRLAIENTQKIYSLLVMRREELSVERATDRRISRIALISPAGYPTSPIGPRKLRNAMIGVLLGMLAGIAGGLVREHSDRTFKSPQELAATLGVPVLGSLSTRTDQAVKHARSVDFSKDEQTLNGQAGLGRAAAAGSEAQEDYLSEEVRSLKRESVDRAFAQAVAQTRRQHDSSDMTIAPPSTGVKPTVAFRGRRLPKLEVERLRSEIILMRRSHNAQIIGFASAHKGEGTSTILGNLAMDLMKFDLRVLLVDLNLAHPALADMFSVGKEPGLAEVIEDGRSLREAVRPIAPGRVFLLPFGRSHENSSFDWEAAARQLQSTTSYCDLLLVDLPPLNEIPQALRLARNINGIVQVVQAERTHVELVKSIKSELERLNVQVLGTVLNRRRFHIPRFIYKRL